MYTLPPLRQCLYFAEKYKDSFVNQTEEQLIKNNLNEVINLYSGLDSADKEKFKTTIDKKIGDDQWNNDITKNMLQAGLIAGVAVPALDAWCTGTLTFARAAMGFFAGGVGGYLSVAGTADIPRHLIAYNNVLKATATLSSIAENTHFENTGLRHRRSSQSA